MVLKVIDGHVPVWRQDKSRFAPKHVFKVVDMLYRCNLELVTRQGMLTGEKYRTDILNPIVVPHFKINNKKSTCVHG